MIQIEGLKKRFGPIQAVDDVSFSVGRGEVLGFLGPNGAGKSTTMKILAGFLPADAGRARIMGYDVATDPIEAKRRLGYMPEGAPSYPDMTPEGFLGFIADVRGYAGAEKKKRVIEAASRTELYEVMRQPIETLSRGFKRRVGLAAALLHDPDVLVLDEPTDGLDPNQKHEMRMLIRAMAPKKAIVISTHILEEVDAVCSRAIIIARGQVVADGTPAALEARSKRHNGVVVTASKDARERLKPLLASLTGVERTIDEGDSLFVQPTDRQPIFDEVRALVRQRGIEVKEVRPEHGHLEDVFRALTVGGAA
ncbi:MAG TPA: ABC transporter ATP-binding protein [Alphaproteobacteria bacterium]|nr:ABC transporter ATP-binding protein [Alphaproteobacteria bacterium]